MPSATRPLFEKRGLDHPKLLLGANMKKQLQYIRCLSVALALFAALNAYPAVTANATAAAVLLEQNDAPFLAPLPPFMVEGYNLYDARFILDAQEDLGLTKEQTEKIENLMLENEATIIRDSAEIKIQELRFASFLKSQSDEIDRKQVEKYIREISQQKIIMVVHQINYLLDVKQVLTPAQLRKLAEIWAKNAPHKNRPGGKKQPTNFTQGGNNFLKFPLYTAVHVFTL
ncbi:MAG: hypothetical protein QG657_3524 [Acidobacteriota bacterium]|nr:hypothetical protein [Acidobacteriota bacterium]